MVRAPRRFRLGFGPATSTTSVSRPMPPPPRRRPGSAGGPKPGPKPGPKAGGAKGGKTGGKPAGRTGAGRPPAGRGGAPMGRAGGPRRDDDRRQADGGRRRTTDERGRDERRDGPPPRRGEDRARGRSRDDDRSRGRDERPARGAVPPATGRGAAWGGLARRAAGRGGTAAPMEPAPRGRLAGAEPSKAAAAFGAAGGRTRHQQDDVEARGEVLEVRMEVIEGDAVRTAAGKAVQRGRTAVPEASSDSPSRARKAPAALTAELAPVVGGASAPRFAVRLADAGRAFNADRFPEAKRILGPMARQAPTSATVRELHGLTLYRLGKYLEAAKELEAFRELTGSTEQHPVLADCYRALGRYEEVEALWRELRQVSPSAELVAEGRIVYAGSLADRGKLAEAIAEVEPAVKKVKRPRDHHLRLLYVLGDLHERAGDIPRARALFDRVLAAEPDFGDAAARRRQLS